MEKAHTYTVEFRIWGKELDPDQITREVGLEPCQIRRAGAPASKTRTHPRGLWAFDGGASAYEFTSLEDAFVFVLDRLGPLEQLIPKYLTMYDVMWWCGHFQSAFDGGPILSSRLLQTLGALGAEVFIDNYFSTSQET